MASTFVQTSHSLAHSQGITNLISSIEDRHRAASAEQLSLALRDADLDVQDLSSTQQVISKGPIKDARLGQQEAPRTEPFLQSTVSMAAERAGQNPITVMAARAAVQEYELVKRATDEVVRRIPV